MARENFNDLSAFFAVARERSFTRAAAQLGLSPSALSHAIRALEARLGLRLLTRTTRSVTPTEAGERVLQTIGPSLAAIDDALDALCELREQPAGRIRITTGDHAANLILWPRLQTLLPDYPDIKVEIIIDYGLADIVAQHCDAGVRLGDQVAKDMIAVRIGPDIRMAVVASPSYLAHQASPQTPQDLASHDCINLRLPTHGGLYAWELKQGNRALQMRVEGRLIFNTIYQVRAAALAGFGLACIPDDLVLPYVKSGHLQCVLEDWQQSLSGFHLYYPNRRQTSRALSVLVDALRYQP
jgi:DNA-binding transcriptional LysR family regulator